MHHEIRFIDGNTVKNTWSDWGLMAMRQPTFVPPPVKRKILELPGGNGEIDLSEAVTGYPLFANRDGSWSFLTPKRSEDFWPIYNQVMQFLHGQRMQAVLPDDDHGWYCEGRFWVDTMACDRLHGVITIGYSVGPFLWSRESTAEPWLWDPFSFVDGVIGNGVYTDTEYYVRGDEVTTTEAELTFTAAEVGNHRLTARFSVAADPLDPAEFVRLTLTDEDSIVIPANVYVGEDYTFSGLRMEGGQWKRGSVPATVSAFSNTGKAIVTTHFIRSYQGADAFGHIEITTTPRTLDFSAAFPDAGVWPLDAAGDAPVTPEFAATGQNVILTATQDGAAVATITIFAGASRTWPNLVLYRGGWLYTGRPAELTAATESGTATLAINFRRGKL